MLKKLTVVGGVVLLGLLVLIQVVPYGRSHANPPVRQEPTWDSAQTRELASRACYDCHSNETEWPWYSHVAPVSWLVQYDVDKGRRELNFSELDRPQREARKAARETQQGKMPQWYYTVLHPDASLSPTERQALIQGLEATFGRAAQEPRASSQADAAAGPG